MKTTQTLSPKFWMVHDTTTTDVLIDTADKGRHESIVKFLKNHDTDFDLPLDADLDDFYCAFHDESQTRFKCELMSIRIVEATDGEDHF